MSAKACLFCLVLAGVVFFPPTACAQASTEKTVQELLNAIRITPPLFFCGEKVPLESGDVRERLERELLLSLWREPQVILWLKRMNRYMPVVSSIFKKHGLPEDLKYLAIIESDLMPHEGSPKGAMGYWQFIEATAQRYGLRVDARFDDRRNIHKSTQAAAAYLSYLHGRFDSWTLAAAAYNMGEEGLEAAILEQKTRDFYRLYLPLETQRYILRAVAVKRILDDPASFGFTLLPADFYPPVDIDPVRFSLAEDTPVQLVAEAAGTDLKVIKDLNPEIRGRFLPPGIHEIAVPRGRGGDSFANALAQRIERSKKSLQSRTYVVEKGDSLASIARRFDVPLPALLLWNQLAVESPIHPGDQLVVAQEP